MLRRVQCTFQRVNWLVVVPAALAVASCGGSIGGDSVTGVSVEELAAEAAAVEALAEDPDLEELDLDGDPALDADNLSDEDDALSADCRRGKSKKKKAKEKKSREKKVLLCHKGRNKWVAESAVKAHLRHGDTLGECPRGATTCPCFSADNIQAAAGACDTTVSATCSTGDPYYLLMSCDPGGSVPPSILGIYLSQTANGGSCSREDIFGSVSKNGLSDAEYQACVDVIAGSGFCL